MVQSAMMSTRGMQTSILILAPVESAEPVLWAGRGVEDGV